MKEIVLITGANGELAKATKKILSRSYHVRCLTSSKKRVDGKSTFYWNIRKKYVDRNALKNCNHIVHLSGHSILKRWNKKNKKLMYDSRVKGSELLFDACKEQNLNLQTFISASAIGIYGLTATGTKYEHSKLGDDWVAKMVQDWEISADKFKEIGSRVIQMRISLLLSKNYGFLKYNLLSMNMGVGIIFISGKNTVKWIHIEDAARFILESIRNKNYQGPYNLSDGNNMNQRRFINIIKDKISPYAIIVKIPHLFINLILGERSAMINNKTIINIDKLTKEGFILEYKKIEDAI